MINYDDNKSSTRIPLQEFVIFQEVLLCSKNVYDIFVFLLSLDEINIFVIDPSCSIHVCFRWHTICHCECAVTPSPPTLRHRCMGTEWGAVYCCSVSLVAWTRWWTVQDWSTAVRSSVHTKQCVAVRQSEGHFLLQDRRYLTSQSAAVRSVSSAEYAPSATHKNLPHFSFR